VRVYTGLDVQSDFGGRFLEEPPRRGGPRRAPGGGRRRSALEADVPAPPRQPHLGLSLSKVYRTFVAEPSRHRPRSRRLRPQRQAARSALVHARPPHRESRQGARRARGRARVPVVQDWAADRMGWATRHPNKIAGVVVLNTAAFVREPPVTLPWLFKFSSSARADGSASCSRISSSSSPRAGGPRKLTEEN